MANFIVSNIAARNHAKIYGQIAKGVFFDLSPSQSGWEEFSRIEEGDTVYVINERRNVTVAYKVNKVVKGLLLADDPSWGSRVESEVNGSTGVLCGTVCERVDMEYSRFVKERNIQSSKLNSETGQMLQGFNCAAF